MARYDYIKVRVDETERQRLEEMVSAGRKSSLSDAIRSLAFDDQGDDRALLVAYIKEVSAAQQTMAELARSATTRGEKINELADYVKGHWGENDRLEDLAGEVSALDLDVYRLERAMQDLQESAAAFCAAVRRVM